MASTTICMNDSKLTKMSSDDHFDISKEPYIETPWNIIETYFKDQHLERLVRHQLESYNNFVGYQIIKTIEMFNPVHIKSENDYDQASGKYSLEIFITFENFHIYRPQIHENNGAIKLMFPQEARLRNFTYASAMTIDINIKYIVRNGPNLENASTFYKTLPKIHIGKLPIMLKSNICVLNQYKYVDHKHTGECRFDAGGHFIINGSEKTVLGQERAAENRVYCFNVSKNNTKYTWSAEIKSVPDFKCISPKQINLYMNSKNNGFGHSIVVQIPRVKQPMPLFVVFRALGVISDKDICEYILLDLQNDKYKAMLENLQASIIESNKYLTQEECIRHIMSYVIYTPINMDKETGTRKKYEFTLDVINNDLFPHCQTTQQKIYFLGYMTNKLLKAQFEWIKADDRDSYLNKRVDLTGTSLNNLFRNYFNKLVKDMEKQIVKEINTGSWRSTEDYTNIINNTNIYKIVKSTTIENGIKRALSTGDFGIKHTNSNKVGVAQVLNRLTYVASLSHLRRISTPTDKSGKLVPPRKLHSTCWGFLCPAETPEGASVGIVKNLSYMTHVTTHSNSMSLYEYVTPHIKSIDTLKPIDTFDKVKVFINGSWIGITEEPEHLYHLLKDMKCKGIINVYASVIFDYKLQEIRVCNDSGRLTRPLLRVKNNQLLLTNQILNDLKENKLSWDDLLTNCNISEAIIEYIDPEEQSYSMISTKPKDMLKTDEQVYKYTHCEIHPSTIFGVVASCIPYPDHNQSPRNTYQCLDINETVLLTNGQKIPIKDVKIGDDVVCFNPETMDVSYTKVVNHYVRETDKTIYKVKTITNKEIIATEDHKFMTLEGWKEVCDFVENDTYIGIMPNPEYIPLDNEAVATLILDENMFRNKFIELGLELSYINKQIVKLSKAGLLPLYSNHHHLPILARIFGFILADGSINIYEKQISCSCSFKTESDVKMFENDIYQCGIDKCKYIKDENQIVYNVTHNGNLTSLIIALGIKNIEIPDWIISGEKIIQREFIAGFEGGDGPIKHRFSSKNDNCKIFRHQYIDLFAKFNISNNYTDKIGYRYSATKYAKEFALEEYKKCKETNGRTFDEDIKIINNMVFMPVVSVEQVEKRLVSDITVESDDHSFIAGNNFLSSNCAQAKQAMGVYATNFNERMDKTAYVLNYPTRPLVDTRVMNLIKLNQIPSGCNINVAIMTHTGYNQEDSVLINKGSIDRGLFQITIYHTEKDEDKQKINGDEEIRCKPDSTKTKGMKFGNYNKVNSKGVIPENTLVENRDIIIAKVSPIKENRNDHMKVIKYEDQSKIYRTVEETYVDKNYIDRNGDGYSFAKVRLRALRKPVIGDKFSSRHGQKGTVGNIIPEEDMPFTRNGDKPDIIINPHAIPSRMTIGQLKETLLGKVLVQLGLFGDGTSFGELDVSTISSKLLSLGYEAHGNELLYNGLTGEQIECSVFMGPVFYQRLKHMVNDKQHSRSIGPMVNLTRQPAEGRSRDGGLRFGEMERDCFDENTPIVTTNGLSTLIKNMGDCITEVLGWDQNSQQMIPSKQIGFLYKGERDCVKLTFQDGRTNICTPDHPILTSNNEWIKAKDLLANETKVKASVNYPIANFNEEIAECNGWTLKAGDMLFETNTMENYLKTLVFAKLIGYLITDGTITKFKDELRSRIYLGHMIDVRSFMNDLNKICETKQKKFKNKNLYSVYIPSYLTKNIVKLSGILVGKKVVQEAQLPDFILDENCPLPIVREFLGGLFGGDGHTCILGMHRGKRDLLTSVSFSQTKNAIHLESLTEMMENIKKLLARFDIHKVTIQKFKETSYSKAKQHEDEHNKNYQLTLHLDIDELIPFHEKIGFRYCCHKSQRLEVAVSYKRLRTEVARQHNWLVSRVDELTKFSEIKKEHPDKIVPTKKAVQQAVEELKQMEPLVHDYAIPSTHDLTDHLIKGTSFGKFTSQSFPTAEEYLKEIGAYDWFVKDDVVVSINPDEYEDDNLDEGDQEECEGESCYGVNRECEGLPTMNLKVIDIRPAGIHPVYDIEVENTHSFLANGIVAHNCMVSHGAARFTRGRMYDASDKYSVYACKKCGLIASYNDELHIHQCRTCDNRTDFSYLEIPYACKLLFQELTTMNVVPRVITDH